MHETPRRNFSYYLLQWSAAFIVLFSCRPLVRNYHLLGGVYWASKPLDSGAACRLCPAATNLAFAMQVLHIARFLHEKPKDPLCIKAFLRRACARQVLIILLLVTPQSPCSSMHSRGDPGSSLVMHHCCSETCLPPEMMHALMEVAQALTWRDHKYDSVRAVLP